MSYCIGIDLGGTGIKAGIVDLLKRQVLFTSSVPTRAPRPVKDIADDIASLCNKLCAEGGIGMNEIEWVGIATPGIVKGDVVVLATNLGWENAPLAKVAEACIGKKVYIANDANTAAYAEAVWGVGEGKSSLVAVTLGTGVGGGIVIDGKILEGSNGFAAELGHVVINPVGRTCGCGKVGCLEAYCSATAIIKESREAMKKNKDSLMWDVCGGNIDKVNAKTPFDARAKGDASATAVIDEFLDYLALGVSNIFNILQPDVVCIGGGVSAQGDNLIVPLVERVKNIPFGTSDAKDRIFAAKYKNEAGIIGAALLGLQKRINL